MPDETFDPTTHEWKYRNVELSGQADGALYLISELMLEGIRQFFTFEESLRTSNAEFPGELYTGLHRHDLQPYFAALEMLRGHFYRCIAQVAVVVNTEVPKISAHMRYEAAWQLEAYEKPEIMARNAQQGH